MRSDGEHVGEGASGVLIDRKGERTRPRKFRKLMVAIASLLIVSAGLVVTMSEAANPHFIGQWFTLYEELQEGETVYKIEGKITKLNVIGVKTARPDIDLRVTNNHPFAIHLECARIHVEDKRVMQTVLVMVIPDSIIEKGPGPPTIIHTTATGMKFHGMGYMFWVNGEIIWHEIHSDEEGPAFTHVISGYYRPVEFTHSYEGLP